MLELQKMKQRVDEFNDYGELDMMQQYVQDVRAVQKRLADAQEQITWVNKEEVRAVFINRALHGLNVTLRPPCFSTSPTSTFLFSPLS